DEISDNAAALLEPLSVGIWANHKAGTRAETSLLIAGAGPIGLVTAMAARAVGATRIAVSDVNRNRLSAALARGSTDVAVPRAAVGHARSHRCGALPQSSPARRRRRRGRQARRRVVAGAGRDWHSPPYRSRWSEHRQRVVTFRRRARSRAG